MDENGESTQQGFDVFTTSSDADAHEDESGSVSDSPDPGTPNIETNTVDDIPAITGESFNEHYFRRDAERNLEENHPERNDPGHSWPIGRFEPHQLGNCKRKWFYRWLNAPQEEQDPYGIFAIGHFIEEEIVEPWLRELVEPEHRIDNAVHVSVDVDEIELPPAEKDVTRSIGTDISGDVPGSIGYNQPDDADPLLEPDSVCLTIAGSTDPVICDSDSGEVIALTEVKSTGSLSRVNGPKRMHNMQIHAYMKALGITDGFVIYVDRDDLLNPKVFEIEFDREVWNTVREWIDETASYALTGVLPPADAPEGWMCNYCEFANRCGEGRSNLSKDMGPAGFVPGVKKYPRSKVEDHLDAYPGTPLTPTLALKFPELAEEHDVAPWVCPNCTAEFDYTNEAFSRFNNGQYNTPHCPACKNVFDESVNLTASLDSKE
jgi:CRISPR/Cas system-associated exonuclease Cas4 (RecB family)